MLKNKIRIREVEINNYRSCLKTKFVINNDLTALIWINWVGKSNILNSIQLLKRIKTNRFIDEKVLQDSFSHSLLTFKLEIDLINYYLKAELYLESDAKNIDEVYSAKMTFRKEGDKKWKNLDLDMYEFIDRTKYFGMNWDEKKSMFTRHQQRIFDDKDDTEIALSIVEYFTNMSYYSATQFSDPTRSPLSIEAEQVRPVRTGRNQDAHSKFIYDLYWSYKNDSKSFQLYTDTVNNNWIGLIEEVKFIEHEMPNISYEIRSWGKIRKTDKIKNIAIPWFVIDGNTLSPNQLSDGTFKTLALVFYILNDKSDLLMIEEPEVCVHHGLLSSIIELIKIQSKHKQIIISTHSDYVLDKLEPENILLIDKNKKAGTQAKSLNQILWKGDYRVLKDYLKYSGNLGEFWKEGGFDIN